ncbi:MAG: hypothetical protein LQ340_003184 [Diploschistes diacapsis]|nr:MAG: hypothetical protein LQ340_003184 [Diploschistes diacapsis]
MIKVVALTAACLVTAIASARSVGWTPSYVAAELQARPNTACNLTESAAAALAYEQSNYVNGVVADDPFYSELPPNATITSPGSIIKSERQTNTSLYELPPTSALSRFIYQSTDSNGLAVPVSAYVLWPYAPRRNPDGYQVVAWGHGTSGFAADCAPSHIRDLWQHFLAPFMLSANGYVVVATDYAGLGVPKNALGQPIVHQYLNSPAAANDIYYSVQAAREAFPLLSKDYVVMGHSQGAGAAWASAQRQAVSPADGYLGAVAISPVTNFLELTTSVAELLGAATAPGIAAALPGFQTSDILTPAGQAVIDQLLSCGGCSALADYLAGALTALPLVPNWQSNPYVQKYQQNALNGGKAIGGPMFVAHGEADPLLNFGLTNEAVHATLKAFPQSQIDFLKLPNVSHVPALQASQPTWMGWIADRFAGVPAGSSNITGSYHARPVEALQPELNWFLSLATQLYETP